jgi:hypothetical protein
VCSSSGQDSGVHLCGVMPEVLHVSCHPEREYPQR